MQTDAAAAQSAPETRNLGWMVTFAAMGINLALGVLYSWSVISKAIPPEWGWSEAQKSLPYSIAILTFAFMMVPAGRLQDRIGPRFVAALGGLFTGAGLILASRTTSVAGYILGFGVLTGMGIGLGYASATPPALKWFSARRTGLIAGLVVSGFGLASVYVAPLANWLIKTHSIQFMLVTLGIGFVVVVSILSQLLINPKPGYRPAEPAGASSNKTAPATAVDYSWKEMLATPQFYLLWILYAFAAGAGLMIVGKLAKIVLVQGNLQAGFIFVAVLAVGNAAGRVVAGMLSDKLGRINTARIVFLLQAIMMLLLTLAKPDSPLGSLPAFVVFSALLGFNYGANLSIFPSVTRDYFGIKNLGVNYGLVFTAWGVGGFVMPYICGRVYDATQSFVLSYYIAAGLLVVALAFSFALKAPATKAETEVAEQSKVKIQLPTSEMD
jgi:OFA family oxalate/formate antiporter-like MFS transporter